jgi:hypothetical protein
VLLLLRRIVGRFPDVALNSQEPPEAGAEAEGGADSGGIPRRWMADIVGLLLKSTKTKFTKSRPSGSFRRGSHRTLDHPFEL